MVLHTTIEEVVNEIKFGKRDLYETIEYYMKLIDSYNDREEERVDKLVTYYENQIEDLEDELETMEELYKAQKDHIEKLEYKIDDLNYLIEELRVTIYNQEREIDILEEQKVRLNGIIDRLEKEKEDFDKEYYNRI